MGGAVSTGRDNDELIDNLLDADYIRTARVASVFRAVDRAEYFLHEARENAYKDLAWKNGNLHLSAPCIYSEVMEGLCLYSGASFLNLGSGTGYLSTMAGLLLGTNGINHGIEIHEDVIRYANKKLDDFKKHSGAIDEFDFCEPVFMQGNCLCLSSELRQYDRVYCGAACPQMHENYMKNLIKIGGILVMPLNDQLLQIKRTSDTTWDVKSLLPVSFASLIQPNDDKPSFIEIASTQPVQLQALCRTSIRAILRKNIDKEFPNLKSLQTRKKCPKRKRALRRLVVPLFDRNDDSSDEELLSEVEFENRDLGRARVDNPESGNPPNLEVNSLIDFILGRMRDRHRTFGEDRTVGEARANPPPAEEAGEVAQAAVPDLCRLDNIDTIEEENESAAKSAAKCSDLENVDVDMEEEKKTEPGFGAETSTREEAPGEPETSTVSAIIEHEPEEESIKVVKMNREKRKALVAGVNDKCGEELLAETSVSKDNDIRTKREKFDSGLGDEIVEKNSSSSSDTSDVESVMELDTSSNSSSSSSSDDEDDDNCHECNTPFKRTSRPITEVRSGGKWRRLTVTSHTNFSNSSSSEHETSQDEVKPSNENRIVSSPYSPLMRQMIQQLPLPPVLKNYLNFYREF